MKFKDSRKVQPMVIGISILIPLSLWLIKTIFPALDMGLSFSEALLITLTSTAVGFLIEIKYELKSTEDSHYSIETIIKGRNGVANKFLNELYLSRKKLVDELIEHPVIIPQKEDKVFYLKFWKILNDKSKKDKGKYRIFATHSFYHSYWNCENENIKQILNMHKSLIGNGCEIYRIFIGDETDPGEDLKRIMETQHRMRIGVKYICTEVLKDCGLNIPPWDFLIVPQLNLTYRWHPGRDTNEIGEAKFYYELDRDSEKFWEEIQGIE